MHLQKSTYQIMYVSNMMVNYLFKKLKGKTASIGLIIYQYGKIQGSSFATLICFLIDMLGLMRKPNTYIPIKASTQVSSTKQTAN